MPLPFCLLPVILMPDPTGKGTLHSTSPRRDDVGLFSFHPHKPNSLIYRQLETFLLTFLNNNIMNYYRIWRYVSFTLDTLILIDVASDLIRKYKIKKWRKNHQSPETKEEDDTATATA